MKIEPNGNMILVGENLEGIAQRVAEFFKSEFRFKTLVPGDKIEFKYVMEFVGSGGSDEPTIVSGIRYD